MPYNYANFIYSASFITLMLGISEILPKEKAAKIKLAFFVHQISWILIGFVIATGSGKGDVQCSKWINIITSEQ